MQKTDRGALPKDFNSHRTSSNRFPTLCSCCISLSLRGNTYVRFFSPKILCTVIKINRWEDSVGNDLDVRDLGWEEARDLAKDRGRWRRVVKGGVDGRTPNTT